MLNKLFSRRKITPEEEEIELEKRIMSMLDGQRMTVILPLFFNMLYGILMQLEDPEFVWENFKKLIERQFKKNKETEE